MLQLLNNAKLKAKSVKKKAVKAASTDPVCFCVCAICALAEGVNFVCDLSPYVVEGKNGKEEMYQEEDKDMGDHTFFNGQLVSVVDGNGNAIAHGVISDDQVDPHIIGVDLKEEDRDKIISGIFLCFFLNVFLLFILSHMFISHRQIHVRWVVEARR